MSTEYIITIKSQINLHCCSVYSFLSDIPYEIPLEIVALISKFYLTELHTNTDVNAHIISSIPKFVKIDNPIPTTQTQCSCYSNNSLLSIRRFAIETSLLLIYGGLFYILCWCFIHKVYGMWPIPVLGFLCPMFSYYQHIRRCWNDVNRIISMPISNANERVFSFNTIFNVSPVIQFCIEAWYLNCCCNAEDVVGPNTSFKKFNKLTIKHCDTLIEPNIYNENEIYRYCCYHIDYDIFIHFNDNQERLKYEKLCKDFINNNIYDSRQRFAAIVFYKIFGIHELMNHNDNHGYIIILNSKQPTVCLKIFRFIATLLSILCLSWVYKLSLYFMTKTKKLRIIQYISLEEHLQHFDMETNCCM